MLRTGKFARGHTNRVVRNEDRTTGSHLSRPVKPLLPLNVQCVSSQSDSKMYIEIQRTKNNKDKLKEK